MRSCTLSGAERFRRLWLIAPEMAGSGLPHRLRLALLALRPSRRNFDHQGSERLLLLDMNENKIPHANREFGEACEQLNPLSVPLRVAQRFLLLGTLFLPGRLHQVAAALVFATNIRRQLPVGSRFALYNPYHSLQYAIANRVPIEKVFHLAPEYAKLANVRYAFACSAAHEILGYSPVQQVLTIQPHTVVEDRPVIRIYLSQLAVLDEHPEDLALIDFVRWVRDWADVSVEIFLHYIDRDVTLSDSRGTALLLEFGDLVRRDASLHVLSSSQVSLSGSSSIGYDLLSSQICHLMVVDRGRWEGSRFGETGQRLAAWRSSRPDVVRFDSHYWEWLKALEKIDFRCVQAVFGGSLAEMESRLNREEWVSRCLAVPDPCGGSTDGMEAG